MAEVVTIQITNQNTDPLEECTCFVYTENGTLVTSTDTNELGRAEVVLPSDEDPGVFYYVRLYKEGCSFDHKYAISVITDDNNTFDIVGSQYFFAPATDPNLCAIHYEAVFQAGSVADISLHLVPVDVRSFGINLVGASQQVSLDRRASFLLPRDSWHIATLQNEVRVCHVPDFSYCSLVDFLYPVVQEITYEDDFSTLHCDTYPQWHSFPIVVTRTDGCILPDDRNTLKAQDYLQVSSSDDTICSAVITSTSLAFTAKKSGTVQIEISTLPAVRAAFIGREFTLSFAVTVTNA